MACFIKVEDEIERRSISSDKLRFFSIGFFVAKELVRERWLAGGVNSLSIAILFPGCSGPYNHVTSWSFILLSGQKAIDC